MINHILLYSIKNTKILYFMLDFCFFFRYNGFCMTARICEVADTLGEVVRKNGLSGNLHGASLY